MNYRSFASTLIVFLLLCVQNSFAQFEECDQEFIKNITITDVTCNGEENGSIDVLVDSTILGNFSFVWSDPGIGNTATAFNLDAGNYSLTLSFGTNEGCIVSDSLFVSEPKILTVECYPAFQIDFMPTTTQIIGVLIGGGTAPFKVDWSGPASGSKEEPENGETLITGLPPGDYLITVTDAEGCVKTCPTTLECEIDYGISETDPTCFGENSGRIEIISEGTLNYKWSTGATTAAVENLAAGAYKVTITEDDCEKIESITLEDPEQIQISIDSTTGDKSRITNTGEAFINISGGAYPYTYDITYEGVSESSAHINGSMSNVAGSLTLSALASGEYMLTVEDEEKCKATANFKIDDIFVVDENDVFILEHAEDATEREIKDFEETLKGKATKLRKCNCIDDAERLQLWVANQIIEINSSEGSGSKTKGDTSGVNAEIVWEDPERDTEDNEECAYPPAKPQDDAKKIQVALIDSGANLESEHNPEGHPSLTGLTWPNPGEPSVDSIDSDSNCIVDDVEGQDVLNDANIVIDSVGHGTHIAGIIADGYPANVDLEIVNLKVFNREIILGDTILYGGVFDLICALHYAINKGAKVINLSLGYENLMHSAPLYRVLKKAERQGITIVASAGNEGEDLDDPNRKPDRTRWPVRFKKPYVLTDSTLSPLTNMIVVAGLDTVDQATADLDIVYSNYGRSSVDLAARAIFKGPYLDSTEITFRGTSMAAGHITRLISIIKANQPNLSPSEIINAIRSQVDTNILHKDLLFSRGKLDANAVLKALKIDAPLYKSATEPPLDEEIGWPPNLELRKGEDLVIKLNLNDTTLLYDNVRFRVFNGLTPEQDFFYKNYCSTSKITWNGYKRDGQTFIPNRGNYFIQFFVGDKEFSPLTRITVIDE